MVQRWLCGGPAKRQRGGKVKHKGREARRRDTDILRCENGSSASKPASRPPRPPSSPLLPPLPLCPLAPVAPLHYPYIAVRGAGGEANQVGSGFSGSGKPGSASHADCMWRARARVSHLRREFDDVGGMLGYNDGGGDYTRLKRELRTAQDQLALCQMARSPARRPFAALPAPPTPSQTAAQPPPALTKPLTLVAPPPPSQQPPPCCRTRCAGRLRNSKRDALRSPPPTRGCQPPPHTYTLPFTLYTIQSHRLLAWLFLRQSLAWACVRRRTSDEAVVFAV